MNRKHDFGAINRVMRLHASVGLHNRAMHLSPAEPPSPTATIEASIGGLPKQIATDKDLGAFLAATQASLLGLSGLTGVNAEAVAKAAEDIAAASTQLKEVAAQAKNAEEIAKAYARMGGGKQVFDETALAMLPLRFSAKRLDEWRGKVPDAQFNLMCLGREDLMLMDERTRFFILRWQQLADDVSIAHQIMLSQKNPEHVQRYVRAGGVKTLPMWKAYETATNQIRAAMDTAEAGAGAEWVPTGVGFSLIGDVRPEFELYRFIERIPMPRSPYLYPVQGNYFRGYFIGESTSDTEGSNPILGIRNVQTRNITFTAQKIGALIYDSSEIDEDSIVLIVAAIRTELGGAKEASCENAGINGQITTISGTTSTFDTGETFEASDSSAGGDDRRAWDGIRYHASLTGISEDASSGLTVEKMTDLKGRLRRFGKIPSQGAWLTGYVGLAKLLVLKDSAGTVVFLTADKSPGGPTAQTGLLGTVLGSPVIVSDLYPETMNASGILDGVVTNYTAIHYFNRGRYRHGEVRAALIEASRDFRFSTDQLAVRMTYRGQTRAVVTPSATETSSGAIVGIAVS